MQIRNSVEQYKYKCIHNHIKIGTIKRAGSSSNYCFNVIFQRGQRGSFFHVTRNGAPYLQAHFPEQVQFPKETVLNHDCVIYSYFAGC